METEMNILERMKFRHKGADAAAAATYQDVLPRTIEISVKQDGDDYTAKVIKADDTDLDDGQLVTEAKDLDTLVRNVNDLMCTYVEMPDHVRPYYGDPYKPKNTDDTGSPTFVLTDEK
jgi:hypothetical protein